MPISKKNSNRTKRRKLRQPHTKTMSSYSTRNIIDRPQRHSIYDAMPGVFVLENTRTFRETFNTWI